MLRNRTVLLVTHTVALAKTVAAYIVLMNLDGSIQSHGPVAETIRLQSVSGTATEDVSEEEPEKEDVKAAVEEKVEKKSGKLIIAEEVALGRVKWQACERLVSRARISNKCFQFRQALLTEHGWSHLLSRSLRLSSCIVTHAPG